jgi:hypothetical protein
MIRRLSTAACLLASGSLAAADLPTVDRVEYVLECMNNNGGAQEYLYKCSCALDLIAKQFTYDQFVEAATLARHQSLAGERGGVFRDPEENKKKAGKFRSVQADANKQCGVKR